MDFLEIEIKAQTYLLGSDNINELIQYTQPQPIASSSKLIEGIISHKNKVIPIVSVRKLLGFETYTDSHFPPTKPSTNFPPFIGISNKVFVLLIRKSIIGELIISNISGLSFGIGGKIV